MVGIQPGPNKEAQPGFDRRPRRGQRLRRWGGWWSVAGGAVLHHPGRLETHPGPPALDGLDGMISEVFWSNGFGNHTKPCGNSPTFGVNFGSILQTRVSSRISLGHHSVERTSQNHETSWNRPCDFPSYPGHGWDISPIKHEKTSNKVGFDFFSGSWLWANRFEGKLMRNHGFIMRDRRWSWPWICGEQLGGTLWLWLT